LDTRNLGLVGLPELDKAAELLLDLIFPTFALLGTEPCGCGDFELLDLGLLLVVLVVLELSYDPLSP
jgi:hypothetical protein